MQSDIKMKEIKQVFFTSYAFTTTVLKHFTKIITQDCAPEQHKIFDKK